MTDRTAAERQARKRERDAAAGWARRTVTIPAGRAAELAAIVQRWRDEVEQQEQGAE